MNKYIFQVYCNCFVNFSSGLSEYGTIDIAEKLLDISHAPPVR